MKLFTVPPQFMDSVRYIYVYMVPTVSQNHTKLPKIGQEAQIISF